MTRIPETYPDRILQIFGMGYVGLTLAVAMAEAGFRVHGVEINPEVLDALASRRAHFSEYGLDARLAAQIDAGRLTASREVLVDEVPGVHIVTVGTPVDADKRTRFGALEAVSRQIADCMVDGALVLLRSTVRVGTTDEFVKPVLAASGKAFDLAFCPERTLEGKALEELRTLPQVVGGIDEESTMRAAQLFSFLTPTIVRVRDARTAEMVKLINNTQRDLMFAFANEVAAICDRIGVSATEVITSGKFGYPRSSMAMPLPGPVGGPCLEKDPYILAEGVESRGFSPGIALAARRWNEELPTRAIADLAAKLAEAGDTAPARIAIFGLAFKGRPETDDLRGTLAVPLAEAARAAFPAAEIVGWDPMVASDKVAALGLTPAADAVAAARGASLVLFQNNHPALEQLELEALAQVMRAPGIIYDFWNQHAHRLDAQVAPGISYRALGSLSVGGQP